MARKPTGNPNGRPPRDFDIQLFENLCHVQCTTNELESILQTDLRTIDKWCQRVYGTSFTDSYKRFAEGGKASLRRNQANLSKKNASMAIWLGKVMLGQTDPQEQVNAKHLKGMLIDAIGSVKEKHAEPEPVSKASDKP